MTTHLYKIGYGARALCDDPLEGSFVLTHKRETLTCAKCISMKNITAKNILEGMNNK